MRALGVGVGRWIEGGEVVGELGIEAKGEAEVHCLFLGVEE